MTYMTISEYILNEDLILSSSVTPMHN